MRKKHNVILKEITDEFALSSVSGGNGAGGGSGDWATGVQTVWATAVEAIAGKSCSWPGGVYGPGNPTPTGSGTCVGGAMGGGRR